MSAVAESWYAPIRLITGSARSSQAANQAEQLARESLDDLKRYRADFLACLNDIEDIYMTIGEAGLDDTRLSDASYRFGKAFIEALPSTAPAPEVTVDADGELVFDWFAGDGRMVSVCVRGNGRLAYAARFGGSRVTHGTILMGAAVPQEIMAAINSLRRSFV